MLALIYLFACLDYRDIDSIPNYIARLRCVTNYILPPVRVY
jgi:hypothetical protein